jgi:hypothetical protein
MNDLGNSQINPQTITGLPAIIRNIEIAKTNVASVNLGKIAVSEELVLKEDLLVENLKPEYDDTYQGVVEINHTEASDSEALSEPTVNDINETQAISEPDKPVKQKYIYSEPYTPTGDDPYPNLSPLLAHN